MDRGSTDNRHDPLRRIVARSAEASFGKSLKNFIAMDMGMQGRRRKG
jgi:hypothetical protein